MSLSRIASLVVDTSASLAALFAEPVRDAVLVSLAEADAAFLSSCCALEASIVTSARLGAAGLNIIDPCSHALAAGSRLPLLAVSKDFARIYIEVVDLDVAPA